MLAYRHHSRTHTAPPLAACDLLAMTADSFGKVTSDGIVALTHTHLVDAPRGFDYSALNDPRLCA